jgi:hypothetical protein
MPVLDISSYQPQSDDKFFLDCNILMYTFYTNGSYAANIIYDYSAFITKIVNAKAQILMTDVLMSEFLNTYIQTEFHRLATINGWPHKKNYFKHTFRFTQDYKDILQELKTIIIRQIIPVFTMTDIRFSKLTFDDMFDNPETFDFNDRYYGRSLESGDTYIVTHDADFSDVSQCNIITKNPSLLSR